LRDTITNALISPLHIITRKSNKHNNNDQDFWALKDVTFDVQQCEVLGIIGRNGAGKSTLLKILSKITEPTEGVIRIRGRVGSLLEVGTGFHPELSGRENIYMNGAILGMSRSEIKRKFDEIVAFAEIEKFIDTPVKRYSSGMYVRLAFAVAAHLEPEILLIDEVLAVGDATFQKKCLGKMGDITKEGRTILFISHNMSAIQTLCKRVIYLDTGMIVGNGDPSDQISNYLNAHQNIKQINSQTSIKLGQDFYLQEFILNPNPIESGSPLNFKIKFWSSHPCQISELAILIYSELGIRISILDLRKSDGYFNLNGINPILIQGEIKSLPLVEGRYNIGLYIINNDTRGNYPDILNLLVNRQNIQNNIVPYSPTVRGVLNLEASWDNYPKN